MDSQAAVVSSEAVAHQHGHVEHHFEDAHQQKDAATVGMWVFLVTEVMFFGGMFLAYFVYRQAYPAAFRIGQQQDRSSDWRGEHHGSDLQQLDDGVWRFTARRSERKI